MHPSRLRGLPLPTGGASLLAAMLPRRTHTFFGLIVIGICLTALMLALRYDPGARQFFRKDRVALLIETRPSSRFLPVLTLFVEHLPEDWPFAVYTTSETEKSILNDDWLVENVEIGKITLHQLPFVRLSLSALLLLADSHGTV